MHAYTYVSIRFSFSLAAKFPEYFRDKSSLPSSRTTVEMSTFFVKTHVKQRFENGCERKKKKKYWNQ